MRNEPSQVSAGGSSILEQNAVAASTDEDYAKRLAEFNSFFDQSGEEERNIDELEMKMLEWFDHKFLEGAPLDVGTKLLAAVGHRYPVLHKSAFSGLLPRARRALQGWGRLEPLGSRLALPMLVLYALVWSMLRRNWVDAALGALLGADAYLRPGELLNLMGRSVIAARPELGDAYQHVTLHLFPREGGVASKTHAFDDSVLLNSEGKEWLAQAVLRWARRAGPEGALIGESNESLNRKLQTVAEAWGLQAWNITAYLLRHTGPSHDHLNRLRPLAEIKRRGRWASDRSVKRYEKAALVTGRLASIPAPVLRRMRECEGEVPEMLRRLVARA